MAPSMTHVMGHHAMGSVSSAGTFESQPIIVTDGSAMPNDAAHRPDGLAKTIDAHTLTAQPARLALHYFIRMRHTLAFASNRSIIRGSQTDFSGLAGKSPFWRQNGPENCRRISVRPNCPVFGVSAPIRAWRNRPQHPLQDGPGGPFCTSRCADVGALEG